MTDGSNLMPIVHECRIARGRNHKGLARALPGKAHHARGSDGIGDKGRTSELQNDSKFIRRRHESDGKGLAFLEGFKVDLGALDFFNDFAIEEEQAFLETRIGPGLDIQVVETIKRSLQKKTVLFHREDVFGARAILGLEHEQIIDPFTETPKGINVGPGPRLGIDEMFKRGHLLMKIRERCT